MVIVIITLFRQLCFTRLDQLSLARGFSWGYLLLAQNPARYNNTVYCVYSLYSSLSLLIDYAAAGAVAQPNKSSASSEHIYLNSPQMRAAAAAAAGFYPAG